MKNPTRLFFFLLFGLFSFSNISIAALPAHTETVASSAKNSTATSVDKSDWDKLPQDAASKIQQNLHKAMCEFETLDSGTVVASTVDGDMSLSTDTNATRFKSGDSWFSLSLDSVGRKGAMKKALSPTLNSAGAKLNLVRKDLTEWYVNHGSNLEHGLVINKKPAGTGHLNFSFTTSGNLAPEQNGKDISFVGDKTINYGGIKAWDVAGKQLVCSMSVDQGQLIWAVDDSEAAYPVTVDPKIILKKKILRPETAPDFGRSVDISEDFAIVGAPFGDDKGTVYIFSKDTGWGLVKKITGTIDYARFGYGVAISNDLAIVGAPYEGSSNNGAAYIFTKNTNWDSPKRITGTEAGADLFGWSVSISKDFAIVGALQEDDDRGAAYIFAKNTNWDSPKRITATGQRKEDSYFGECVSISNDLAIVGAPGEENDRGAAYLFTKNTDWNSAKRITGTGAGEIHFGNSVSISDDLAIVGASYEDNAAGAAYIFAKNTNWDSPKRITATGQRKNNSYFGNSVSISDDLAIVGAKGEENDRGAAYIFSKNTDWTLEKRITGPRETGAQFGYRASISGNLAIVGAYGGIGKRTNAAYIYIYVDPTKIVVPAPNQPAVNLLEIETNSKKPKTTAEVKSTYKNVPLNSVLDENVYKFTASVAPGSVAYFCFNSSCLGERKAEEVEMVKLFTDQSSKNFTYSINKSPVREGYFWITDEGNSGQYVDPKMILTKDRIYTINYSVKDNGAYDLDSTLGQICDPVVLGTSSSGGSDKTGCVMNPKADFSMELLGLLIVALGGICLRMRRKIKFKNYFPCAFLLLVLLSPTISTASTVASPTHTAKNSTATSANKSGWDKLPQDAASKIQKNLHKAMCKFETLESGTVVASTVGGDMSLSTNTNATRFKSGDSWFSLSLDSVGRKGAMKKAPSPTLNSAGAKLNLVRKDLTEWYVNHGSNLEHGLVINKKPAGTGHLIFSFTTSGNLAPKQNGKDISFVGDKTINYGSIKAWDVAGKQLVCSMSCVLHVS